MAQPSLLANADILFRSQQWENALVEYQRALSTCENQPDLQMHAFCLQRILACLVPLGRCTEAIGIGGKALAKTIEVQDRPGEASVRTNLARALSVFGEEGSIQEAVDHLNRASQIYEGTGNILEQCQAFEEQALLRERQFLLSNSTNRALLHECEALSRKALDLLHRVPLRTYGVRAPIEVEEARLESTLARCRYHERRWEAAAARFERADSIAKGSSAVLPSDLALWGHALFYCACADDKNLTDRLQLLGSALEKIELAVKHSERLGDVEELVEIHALRGDTYWELYNHPDLCGFPSDEWPKLDIRVDAATDYEIAIQLIDKRPFLLSRPADRIVVIRRYDWLYARVVEAYIEKAKNAGKSGEGFLERAFHYSERSKAAALSQLIRLSSEILSKVPEDVRTEVESAERAQREAYISSELRTWFRGDDEARATLRERAWIAEQHLVEVQGRAFRAEPALAGIVSHPVPLLGDVAAALPQNGRTMLLQLSLTENYLCGFLIGKKIDFTSIPLTGFGPKGLTGVVERFLQAQDRYAEARRRGCTAALEDELEKEWLKELASIPELMARMLSTKTAETRSLLEMIQEAQPYRLVIVPDGLLHRLPLHAGISNSIAVVYAPSCSIALQTARRLHKLPSHAVVVDNPDGTLPATEFEGMLVESHFQRAGIQVERLSREQATLEAVFSSMSRATWVHYAGHAISLPESPWESGLTLTDAEKKQVRLKASDLLIAGAVPVGAVAVIDGCSSGSATVDTSREFTGLPAALLAAGYSVVVSNCYEVLEGPPSALMDYFYNQFLEEHKSLATALREAVSYLRSMQHEQFNQYERQFAEFQCGRGTHPLAMQRLIEPDDWSLLPIDHPSHWLPFMIWGAGWSREEIPPAAELKAGVSFEFPLPSVAGISPQLLRVFRQADELARSQDYSGQITVLEHALRQGAGFFFVHSDLAAAWNKLREPARALLHEIEALRRDPNSAVQQFNLGRTYLEFARIAEARDCFQVAVRLNPGFSKAWFNLGVLSNDPREAVKCFERAALIDPNDRESRYELRQWKRITKRRNANVGAQRVQWARQAYYRRDRRVAQLQLALAREFELSPADRQLAHMIEEKLSRDG